mgnify:CR=1 FL=1
MARQIRELLAGSELIARPKQHVQDPYSFRCIPQVHGASKDAIDYCTTVMLAEVNGVTDNPNVFPPPDLMAKLVPDMPESAEFTKELTRAWTRFRTGQ